MATRHGRRIQSVEIAFSIISFLQERNGARVTEIADELGHSKSTVHSHLQTLNEQRIIAKRRGEYFLGMRFLKLAERARHQVGNYEVIKSEVESLSEEAGELAQFGIMEYDKIAYLCKIPSENAVQTVSDVGSYQPLHTTALGKSILAFLPQEEQTRIVRTTDLRSKTKNSIDNPDELMEELEKTAERGFGIDDEENIPGLRCVAAPVKDDEEVLGAISVSGPSSRFTDERLHNELSTLVQRSANVIELNTKFS